MRVGGEHGRLGAVVHGEDVLASSVRVSGVMAPRVAIPPRAVEAAVVRGEWDGTVGTRGCGGRRRGLRTAEAVMPPWWDFSQRRRGADDERHGAKRSGEWPWARDDGAAEPVSCVSSELSLDQ